MNYDYINAFIAIFVLFTAYIGMYLVVKTFMNEKCFGLCFCFSVTLWLAVLFVITESLGLFRVISKGTVFGAWGLVIIGEITICIIRKKDLKKTIRYMLLKLKDAAETLQKDIFLAFLVVSIVIVLARSSWLALHTVPNNYDSMTYHLTRIMLWIEHASVSYFDTFEMRHLVSPMLAEYINLHLILISGNDLMSNMVQNLSFYGCVIAIWIILRRLGIDNKWTLITCLMLVTSNAFFAEAITTQNDLVAAFILLIDIYILLHISLNKKCDACDAKDINVFIILGLCSGLLYLTKSHVAIPALIIAVLVIGIRLVKRDKITTLIKLSICSVLMALIIVGPMFYRNYTHYGDIFALKYMDSISIASAKPQYLIVNIAKNYGNMAVNKINGTSLVKKVTNFADSMEVDINAREISFSDIKYELYYSLTQDSSSVYLIAPLLILGLMLGIMVCIFRRKQNDFFSLGFLLALLVTMAIIRWQPWVVRLLLPSIALALTGTMYFIGSLLALDEGCIENTVSRFERARNNFGTLLASILVFYFLTCSYASFDYLRENAEDNIEGRKTRQELYFVYASEKYTPYKEVSDLLREYSANQVGLFVGGGTFQYPILADFYQQKMFEFIEMTDVDNAYKMSTLNADFKPDVIVVMEKWLDTDKIYYCNGNNYKCVFESPENESYMIWEKI